MQASATKTAPLPARPHRLRSALYWGFSPALCLALYWPGLRAWFQQDDFAWLGLGLSVHGPRDLLHVLFAPMAQGTIRPLSERAFFLLMHALFGLWASPYRACVFLTQFANLVLLSWICRRLTGSRLAGFLAPVFWTATAALALPMSWTSAWNQLLCGFFLLLAFACLLGYIETGGRAWLAGQWAAFLLGLGALELAVVYPALAVIYCAGCARRHLRIHLPLLGAAAGYALLHFWAAPSAADPVYRAEFGWAPFRALPVYWAWAMNVSRLPEYMAAPGLGWAVPVFTAVLTAALLGFAGWQIARRKLLAAFLLAWFVLLILPVLPFSKHLSEYYLTLPSISLAVLGAWGFSSALRAGWRRALLAEVLALGFLFSGGFEAHRSAQILAERSYRVRTLVYGVAHAARLHPGKTLILTGVEDELFWAGIRHRPFRLVGAGDVFLAPEQAAAIQAPAEQLQEFVIPPGVMLQVLAGNRGLVYQVESRRLQAVTWRYLAQARERWRPEEPRRLNVAQQTFAAELGPTWYKADSDHRWMPQRATVWLGGPKTADGQLLISGYCPAALLAGKPLRVALAVDGKPLRELLISKGDSQFRLAVPLPPELAGRPRIEVSLAVDRTFRAAGDVRDLGLAFGTFEVRN